MHPRSLLTALIVAILFATAPASAQHKPAKKSTARKGTRSPRTEVNVAKDEYIIESPYYDLPPPFPEPPPTVFNFVEEMPQFPGNLPEFINANMHYPDSAYEAGTEGRVVIKFIVRKDGSITGATVVRGADTALNREALRIISIMPKWIPGKQQGVPVDVRFTLPVTFRID